MEQVQITGLSRTVTLSTGKKVSMVYPSEGDSYGFSFGLEDDGVSFALSREAVGALKRLLALDKATPTMTKWVVTLHDDGGDE